MLFVWKQTLLFMVKSTAESDVHTAQATMVGRRVSMKGRLEGIEESGLRQTAAGLCLIYLLHNKRRDLNFISSNSTSLSRPQVASGPFPGPAIMGSPPLSVPVLWHCYTCWQVRLHLRVKCSQSSCKPVKDKTFMWPCEASYFSCSFRLWFRRFSSMNPK